MAGGVVEARTPADSQRKKPTFAIDTESLATTLIAPPSAALTPSRSSTFVISTESATTESIAE
jgi:hypothetical protein